MPILRRTTKMKKAEYYDYERTNRGQLLIGLFEFVILTIIGVIVFIYISEVMFSWILTMQ